MKKRSSRRTTFENLLGETKQPCRVWWNAQESALYCTQSGSPVRIKSPDHLQMIVEHEPVVYVSNWFDQFPARFVLFEVAPEAKIELITGIYRTKASGGRPVRLTSGKNKFRVYKRAFHRPYDVPLARLQMAVSQPDRIDPVAAFAETLIGQFHEAWSLPYSLEAAQLWAQIGDVFNWVGPKNLIPLDLSQPHKVFNALGSDNGKKAKRSGAFFEMFVLFLCSKQQSPCLPAHSWPLGSRVLTLARRRTLRDLIPLAWSGTPDPKGHLDALVQRQLAQDFLSDPRRWLWRAVLRQDVAAANVAYLEAAFAWVLSRLYHPELFPPANPLFDEPAVVHFRQNICRSAVA